MLKHPNVNLSMYGFLVHSEANHSPPETSESAASRPSPHSNPEIAPGLCPHPNYLGSSPPGSTTKVLNGNSHLYALPKPHGKEVSNSF